MYDCIYVLSAIKVTKVMCQIIIRSKRLCIYAVLSATKVIVMFVQIIIPEHNDCVYMPFYHLKSQLAMFVCQIIITEHVRLCIYAVLSAIKVILSCLCVKSS